MRKLYREAALAYHRSKPNRQKQMNVYRTWTHRILVCLYQILITPLEKKKKSSIRYTPLLTLHFKVYHHHHLCQLCRFFQDPHLDQVDLELDQDQDQVKEQESQQLQCKLLLTLPLLPFHKDRIMGRITNFLNKPTFLDTLKTWMRSCWNVLWNSTS